VHEVGVMQDALEVALEHARRQGAQRIHRITLRVGPLAGVVPESLAFAFDVVARGTIAEGARLEVQDVPVVCFCPACAEEFRPGAWFFECPRCGQATDQVRQGRELELASLEVS
jgi:hydrogenase nickel incorporation protein HypA/HybF